MAVTSDSSNTTGKQLSITKFGDLSSPLEKYSRNHPIQKNFDNGILNMIGVDGLHYNFVNGFGFKTLIHNMDPRLTVKTRQTYVNRLNESIKNQIVPALKKNFKGLEARFCHFSCDIWTTRRREGVLGFMAHYINEDCDYRSSLVSFKAMKEQHSGENIRNTILECLREVGIPKAWVSLTNNLGCYLN